MCEYLTVYFVLFSCNKIPALLIAESRLKPIDVALPRIILNIVNITGLSAGLCDILDRTSANELLY